MAKRYFKATVDLITVFRASEGRVYRSVTALTPRGYFRISFSSSPGPFPTVEITQSEYETLIALKHERLRCSGLNPKYSSPQDSWVTNSSLDQHTIMSDPLITGE